MVTFEKTSETSYSVYVSAFPLSSLVKIHQGWVFTCYDYTNFSSENLDQISAKLKELNL